MFLWNDIGGISVSYTTIEEEKAKEKETVKKYLTDMRTEIMSKFNSDINKRELFKLLKAIELVEKYMAESEDKEWQEKKQ